MHSTKEEERAYPAAQRAGQGQRDLTIWGFALGYFLCYVPYSALTKALTGGQLPGVGWQMSGFELLPASALASMMGVVVFFFVSGWWRHAGQVRVLGLQLPVPGFFTALSGTASALIIATTTLSYSIAGASVVFMALLMRGGVLVLAPGVDVLAGRRVSRASWVALTLSLLALLTMFSGAEFRLGREGTAVLGLYLFGYFVRLRVMSHLAKSSDVKATLRFFVEEQLVATPAFFFCLAALAVIGQGEEMQALRRGFVGLWAGPWAMNAWGVVIGLMSQGAGIFGGLVLLDRRENTFCVPVNRASSVLAGLTAGFGLALFAGQPMPERGELAGAVLIVMAIGALAWPRGR